MRIYLNWPIAALYVYQNLKIMNNEPNFQKILQREFKSVPYIITLRANNEGLQLEFESKYTGDTWECYYEPQYIEQITNKAGNSKKYNKFIDMLVKCLPGDFVGDGYELFVDLLTHHDLEMQANRKSGVSSKSVDPKLINKRYLILSYITAYDKTHYPFPLQFVTEPDPQKLKLSIRRLGQQLQYCELNPKTDEIIKQLTVLKQQNQLIKSKLKNTQRNQSKENVSNNLQYRQMEDENQRLRQELAQVKEARDEEIAKKNKIIQEKDKKILEYEAKIKKLGQESHQYQQYQDKFNALSKQTMQIASALQHSRQNQKKSQLKIANLEKQLEKMMALKKKTNPFTNNILNSPRRSDNGSVKSNNSQSKKNLNNKSNNKVVVRKNSSIYDSDTQSSKMRKQNTGRVSPYRQTSRPLNTSNSAKKKESQRNNAISKYSNISSLYNKDRARNRSRSKSKSVKRQISPPSDNFQSSAVMTEQGGIDYPSDNDEDNKVSETMAKLRNHRNRKIIQDKTKIGKDKKNAVNPIEERINSIATLMRTLRNNNTEVQSRN